MSIHKYTGIITLLAPLSHNSDESLGVDTKFRRVKYFVDGEGVEIPIYSGNAIRGILRRLAAKDFLERIGIEQTSDRLYYALFTGGSIEKGSQQEFIEIGLRRELRRNMPFISLFGTAFQNEILSGLIDVGMAIPISRETAPYTGVEEAKSIFEMTTEIFYTRRDDLEDREGDKQGAQQMKYTIECLAPGVRLHHTFTLTQANQIEQSCFGHVMSLLAIDPVLGGKSGVGHGKVALSYAPEFPDPAPYLKYLEDNKESIAKYVNGISGAL
jgi:hypothetical protein